MISLNAVDLSSSLLSRCNGHLQYSFALTRNNVAANDIAQLGYKLSSDHASRGTKFALLTLSAATCSWWRMCSIPYCLYLSLMDTLRLCERFVAGDKCPLSRRTINYDGM